MAVLTYGQRKYIEARIRNYYLYKEDIAEWRETIINGSHRSESGTRSPRYASDPTATTAIRLSNPPKNIRDMELWVEAIDAAHERFKSDDKGKLFEVWYWKRPQSPYKAALALNVSEDTFKLWRRELEIFTALIAAQKGIFTLV